MDVEGRPRRAIRWNLCLSRSRCLRSVVGRRSSSIERRVFFCHQQVSWIGLWRTVVGEISRRGKNGTKGTNSFSFVTFFVFIALERNKWSHFTVIRAFIFPVQYLIKLVQKCHFSFVFLSNNRWRCGCYLLKQSSIFMCHIISFEI